MALTHGYHPNAQLTKLAIGIAGHLSTTSAAAPETAQAPTAEAAQPQIAATEPQPIPGVDAAAALTGTTMSRAVHAAGPAARALDQPASQRRHAYVGNNPLNLTDPTGLSCTSPRADSLGVIYTWSCTTSTKTGRELRSDGYWDVGYTITTHYTQGRMQNWDGSWFEGEVQETEGPQVPWERWAAPPPPAPGLSRNASGSMPKA